MSQPRPTPFGLVFGEMAGTRFPAIQRAIAGAGADPRERDAVLLVREAAELVRDLEPEGGLGGDVMGLAALVHEAYLFWLDGARTVPLSEPALGAALAAPSMNGDRSPASGASSYVQLPPLRVWGTPIEGDRAEPLDGWFRRGIAERLQVLAVFGLHPGREGFTVVEVAGPAPDRLIREDGSPLFAPTLEGGEAAGLASVAGAEELLELAWRAEEAR